MDRRKQEIIEVECPSCKRKHYHIVGKEIKEKLCECGYRITASLFR